MLGLCYYRKSAELLEAMGQGEYALDLDEFETAQLTARLRQIVGRYSAESETIEKKNVEFGEALNRQYEMVLGLAG